MEISYYPENDYRCYLRHSAKGTKWKEHKYIAIRDGVYLYPQEDIDEYTSENTKLMRRKKNAKKVHERMKKEDRKRLYGGLFEKVLVDNLGTDKGKALNKEKLEKINASFNATMKRR